MLEKVFPRVETPPTPLYKKYKHISDNNLIKTKTRCLHTVAMLETYEFKMVKIDSGNPEELMNALKNYDKTVISTRKMTTVVNITFLYTLIFREDLH